MENLTESRTFVRNICHREIRLLDRAIHLPPTPGFAPRRLEKGEFSPTFVKKHEAERSALPHCRLQFESRDEVL
jgi:hypothetical protein